MVVANRNPEADAHLKLKIPVEKLGVTVGAKYRLTDVWKGDAPRLFSAQTLSDFSYTVRRDRSPRGGIGVIEVKRIL